ncbi:hypothetical protein [Geodermatophilus ruber]|uniref:Uncharacterized protein n=1 Tax=Geodermatophilus ruber TaxID=504800 RepID=A0A1I4BKR5_9ACTN|nr:hypothetical protein [Geodermatophilus ruber]SFK68807.1 hypothetical protein SAMN04488085_10367 [Geodermatophilus ruber]
MRAPASSSRRGRLPGWLGGSAALALAGLVGVSLWLGGYRQSEVVLSSGMAWLASPQGLVTLVDGASQQVIGNVQSAAASEAVPAIVQLGTSALVVDEPAGTVARIDGATYAVTGPEQVGGGGPLQVLPDGDQAFVVDGARQVVTVVDTGNLETRETIRLDAAPADGQAVLDRDGVLWVVDGEGLTRVDRSREVTRAGDVGDRSARLVTVRGGAVLVDPTEGRIGRVDADGEVPTWACEGLRLGSEPRLLGSARSARLFAAVPDTGELLVADLDTGTCTPEPLAPAGTDLGTPVESGRFVLVPDRATGRVVVVDTAGDGVVATPAVANPGPGLELIAKDGLVFYNDSTGPVAGVVQPAGGQWVPGAQLVKFTTGATAVPSLAAADDTLAVDPAPRDVPTAARTTASGPPAATGGPSGTTVPRPTTPVPVPTTTVPRPTTTVPVPTTTVPVPTTTVPVPTTTVPVPTTTVPRPTTTVPAPTTTEPVPTTTVPVPTTTVPVPTTTVPVPPPTTEPG